MGRKKSTRKGDFQKIKLKVGRTLPKGQNVTETKFKTKKIKVPQQHKSPASEIRAHRHQTIEELLKRSEHTNVSVRHEAYLGIGKLLNSNKDAIDLHLSSLIQVAAAGFHDYSRSVRNEAAGILSIVLQNSAEVKIATFSSLLLPHLCCAMTNLQHPIRVDSLRVLDMCLNTIPAVITSSEKVLKNLLSQISFEKREVVCEKGGFEVSKIPAKTASERVKRHNWRATVLGVVAKFLKETINGLTKEETGHLSYYSPIKIPGMKVERCAIAGLENYVAELMPVLFDIWVEAAPIPYTKSDCGEVVSAEAAEVMDSVLQVICLICAWIKITDEKKKNTDLMTWFNSKYRKQIFGRLMVWFPYSQRIPSAKKRLSSDTEVSCLAVNLAVCHIFSMMPQASTSISSKLFQEITEYLLHVINRDNSGRNASLSLIIKILKQLMTTNKLEVFEPHLHGLLKRYRELDEEVKEKEDFEDFILDLILDIRNKDYFENMPLMKHFARALLQDMVKMHQKKYIVKHTLRTVKQLNAIGFLPFVNELQANNHILLELIQNEEREIQQISVFLLSRLTHIPFEYFYELAKVFLNPVVQVETISALLSILSQGLRHPLNIPAFTGKDFANFLFSVAVGMFKCDADSYQMENEQSQPRDAIPFHLSEYVVVQSKSLERHFEITQAAVRTLRSFSDKKQMARCIHRYLIQFTTHCVCFPVHTGLGLLLLACEARKTGEMPDMDCLLCITEITIALFMYQFALEQDIDPSEIPSGSIVGALFTIIKRLDNMGNICEVIMQRIRDIHSMEQAEIIGRVMLVALRKKLLPAEDINKLLGVLHELHNQCGDDVLNELWWIDINSEAEYYAEYE